MNVDLMEFFYKLIGIGVVWLLIMGTLILKTYTFSIIVIGAYIGVDRYLYLREKYTKWKARKKEELE